MILQEKIKLILKKLSNPDTILVGEREIKALIVEEIDNGEKLNILINCIGDDKDLGNS